MGLVNTPISVSATTLMDTSKCILHSEGLCKDIGALGEALSKHREDMARIFLGWPPTVHRLLAR
jgi:hypothetical protein